MSYQVTDHFFHGGVDRDTAAQAVENIRTTFLKNFRLQTHDQKGSILNNVKGNEFQFELTDGFIPLGYVSYNGIAFIFSTNTTTLQGEIGTYPSPNINGAGGFQPVYRPLQNWNGATDPRISVARQDFRTTLFTFACSNLLKVIARISYDNSLELFFVDYLNPFRHLNCGFDIETGIFNNRLLWEGSFPNQVNVFFESCGHPTVSDMRVMPGGELQAGNWFVYTRYQTIDFNNTSFLTEVGPIQISQDDSSQGWQLDGDAGLIDTGKAIELDLINIDSTFPYLQVALVYYHDDTFDTRLLSVPFQIPPGATTLNIRINGTEEVVDITLGEIITRKAFADVPRTVDQMENMCLIANVKERTLPISDMQALAALVAVKPSPNDQLYESQDRLPYRIGETNGMFQYKDYNETFDHVGHFRGETYPFAIVFVFKDGKESKPFPIKGYDAWFDPGATTPNTKGILRFPANTNAGYAYFQDRGNGWRPQVLGVVFDTTGVVLPQWATDQVCGFYFMRGERTPNLIYQGFVGNAFRGIDQTDPLYFFPFSPSSPVDDSNRSVNAIVEMSVRSAYPPGFMLMPYEVHIVDPSPDIVLDAKPIPPVPNRYGLFSTDHFFKRDFTNGQYTMVVQGYGGEGGLPRFYERQMNASYTPAWYLDQARFTPETSYVKGVGQLTNILPRNSNANNGFTSGFFFGDDSNLGLPIFYYAFDSDGQEIGNREMWQRNYIGITFAEPGTVAIPIADDSVTTPSGPAFVNIYKTDPTPPLGGGTYDITVQYEPSTTTYFRVTPFIPIADWDGLPARVFYKGDCFVQRTHHRHLNERGFHTNGDTASGLYYVYGNLVGSVQECTVNTAMRFEAGTTDVDERYYPEKVPLDPIQFAAQWCNRDETRALNNGYNQTTGIKGALGNDPLIPFQGLRHPTRIMYSHTYLNEAFSDGYLQWDFDAWKDYNHGSGQIMEIGVVDDKLISVQERAVNFHYVNDRALIPSDVSEAELLVGTGDVLSQKCITRYAAGTQHQWSIVRSDRGMYGYDQKRRRFWRINAESGLQLFSDDKRFHQDAVALSQILSTESDILNIYGDSPLCGDGVVGFWDQANKDVGWSFCLNNFVTYETIVYNEKQEVYMGVRSHHSPFYLLINNDLYSIDKSRLPLFSNQPRGRFFIHDANLPGRCNFYGVQHEYAMEFVCNAATNRTKVYDSMTLAMTDIAPTRMFARTQFQLYTLDPFLAPQDWKRPVYEQNMYRIPVLVAEAVVGNGTQEYAVGSNMRGTYLSVRMEWDDPRPVEVVSASIRQRLSVP